MIRVIVIGARCVRQGIGEFTARWLAEAGASVVGVVGTRTDTAEEARAHLLERYQIHCRAYASVQDALQRERPDAVAIASPHGVHAEQLRQVAAAGAHCLCDKPLWWDTDLFVGHPGRVLEQTEELVSAFVDRGLRLELVTQWPCTLGAYAQLFPGSTDRVERFDMRMSPITTGLAMVPDAAPHPLSMLSRLHGPGDVSHVVVAAEPGAAGALRLEFRYRHAAGSTAVGCRFVPSDRRPRIAGYAINGEWAERRVCLEDYSMSLVAGGREVPLEDPLRQLVAGFVARVEAGAVTEGGSLVAQVRALQHLAQGVQEQRGIKE